MSSPAIRHWHWWTWLKEMPLPDATLENTLSKSLIFSLLAGKRYGMTSGGAGASLRLSIIKGIEQSLDNLQRRGTSRPAIVVVSYAGNDIFGNYGFIHCEWLNQDMACYSQKRRNAANAMIEERMNTHFSALNDLVKLSPRHKSRRWEHRPGDAMVRSCVRIAPGL